MACDSHTNAVGIKFSIIYSMDAINSRSLKAENRKLFDTVNFTCPVGQVLCGLYLSEPKTTLLIIGLVDS